jgi:hypothetical protein
LNAYCLRQWHQQSIVEVIDFLAGHGYEFWAKRPDRFLFSDEVDQNSFVQDALLVPTERRVQYAHWLAPCAANDRIYR